MFSVKYLSCCENYAIFAKHKQKSMNKTYFKYKYVLIFILSLLVFIGGLNYKHWYVTDNLIVKHISLIYSISKDDIGNRNIEKLLYQEFQKQGIEVTFDKFYLDCSKFDEKEEKEHVREYLGLLESKSTDLILTVGDQATNSLLSTRHRLLSSIPVVACNVHFPNEELIEEYDSQKVYVLRDSPDLKRNIDFIKTLYPQNDMEIIYNIDLTFLGHKSFDSLSRVVDRKNVRVLGYQKAFVQECDYKHLTEMIEYFNLTPGLINDSAKRNGLTISLCPFRYIKGSSLLVMLKQSKRRQQNQAFLLDKLDMLAIPIVTALNIPSFSCIREGFGENAKIVGGYMATEGITAKAAASLATRLLKKEKTGMPKIRDLEKEYVLDWTYFSEYAGDISNVPQNVRMINYPFYDRYRKELYLLGGLFVFSFILVTISLLRTHRRSLMEHKNLQMLEEAHKRLTLSMNGGKISLWNIQEGVLEFDDNYVRLVGMEQRRFTKEDIMRYTHPDDVQLLSSFYETLYQSPSMQIQRIRFCFGGKEADYQWYELRCSTLKDAQGEIMLAGIMQNIQNLVEHEQQLILAKQIAEKAELKQSFLNNMSHEIRTPLNSIVGFSDLLKDIEAFSPEEVKQFVDTINTNCTLLLALINDILDLSRIESGSMDFRFAGYNLTFVMQQIYDSQRLSMPRGVELVMKLPEGEGKSIVTDSVRLKQVINNFINNAKKFTTQGSITFGFQTEEPGHTVFFVEDTGSGISEENQRRIFERFYKVDSFTQGAGLGLSICQTIVERFRGEINVSSELGKGTRFTVRVPDFNE